MFTTYWESVSVSELSVTWCVAELRRLEAREEVLDFFGSYLYPYMPHYQPPRCVCTKCPGNEIYGQNEGGREQNKVLTFKKNQ